MANSEHLKILNEGVKPWNAWRAKNPETQPDLMQANLRNMTLAGANLSDANLNMVDLSWTTLKGADLGKSTLFNANLCMANLVSANLCSSFLWLTQFSYAQLSGAMLCHARFSQTVLAGTNLSNVRGLELCVHDGPSLLDIETLQQSGTLPIGFLRGCGLSDAVIKHAPSLLSEPVYSCFISYSTQDQVFVQRLYDDLQNEGVRSWFAPEDLKIGEQIRIGIDESILQHDKLLLVLSEASIKSRWVESEVETALAKEHEQKRTVLFPIRLDNGVMEVNSGWPALIKRTRHIGDFTDWREETSYRKALARLLRDLRTRY